MLELEIPGDDEKFDDDRQKFVSSETTKLRFEHSLVSVSKWESEFERPFLGDQERTTDETLAYVRMMCLDEIPPEVFSRFTSEHYNAINAYINKKMTATTITERPGAPTSREIITSELMYYWMVTQSIPFECQHWHLSRLLMLIRVCNHKNRPAKKMSRQEAASQRHQLNQQRKAKLGSRG